MERIEFHATIPNIQSAINIGGDQATRIKLDIPASEIADVLKLSAYGSEKLLKISVEVQGD